MKNIVILLLLCGMISNVNAVEFMPRYKIIASSNYKKDIEYMYEVKNNLLKEYSLSVKGVDNKKQVLLDHLDDYNAVYKDDKYVIVIGEGKGHYIEGELRTHYCESSKDIKKKSFIWEWLMK